MARWTTATRPFFSQIEGKANVIIQKLQAGELIAPEERVDLAMFIALLLNRVPRCGIEKIADATGKAMMKEVFPTIEAVEEHLQRERSEDGPFSAQDFFDFIHKEQCTIEGNRSLMSRFEL